MELPSTSTMTPPPAFSTTIGNDIPSPAETAALRRSISACDFGPGIAVTNFRSCGICGPVVICTYYLAQFLTEFQLLLREFYEG